MAGRSLRLMPALVLACAAAGCDTLGFTKDEMRSRTYPGAGFEEAFKAAGRAINDRFGSVQMSDRETGVITSGSQKYNPNGLGLADLGRVAGGGYRSKVQAIVERSPGGSKVNLKVVVERYEEEKRQLTGGLGGGGDDILFDDRRPNGSLQDTLYTAPGRGGTWRFYRVDGVMTDSLLADIERQLRPQAGPPPEGRAPDTRPPAAAPVAPAPTN